MNDENKKEMGQEEQTQDSANKKMKYQSDIVVSSDLDDAEQNNRSRVVSSDELWTSGQTIEAPVEQPAPPPEKIKIKKAPKPKKVKPPRKKRYFPRIFKFALVGTLTGLLALGTFTLFMYIYDSVWAYPQYRSLAVFVSEYSSVLFSCVLSFLLNSKFTFSDRKARRAGMVLYILYYLIATGLGALLILWLNNLGLDYALAKLVKMTINVVLDFVYCRFFIFRFLQNRYNVPIEELTEEPLADQTQQQ